MRRKQAEKRIPIPDPIYGDVTVAKFIAAVMRDGKKSVAQRLVYGAFDLIEERTGEPGVEVFRQGADQRGAPRRGPQPPRRWRHLPGAHRGPPRASHVARVPLAHPVRRRAATSRWPTAWRPSCIAASRGEGGAVKKKDDTHRMAEANKAFAHFAASNETRPPQRASPESEPFS